MDQEPLFNFLDIDDANGPVNTEKENFITRLQVNDKKKSNQAPGGGVFSNKYRSEFDEPSPSLALTTSYQTIFDYSGSGKFIGFVATFSNSTIVIKFSIDSTEIFELEASQVNDAQFNNPTSTGPASQTTTGGPIWDSTSRRFGFMPNLPIEYLMNVKIEAKKKGAPAANYNRSIVNLTKET